MLSALLAIGWEPEIRGYIVVLIMVGVLIGGSYMLIGSNLGARLGFLVTATALAGWMMSMAIIWAVYGIGLKGPDATWKPAEPVTIVRGAAKLNLAEVLEVAPDVAGKTPAEASEIASKELQAEGWRLLEESDPQRGQAVASADKIIQVETEEFKLGEYQTVEVFDRGGERYPKLGDAIDFFAFKHKPRYSIVEVATRAPAHRTRSRTRPPGHRRAAAAPLRGDDP